MKKGSLFGPQPVAMIPAPAARPSQIAGPVKRAAGREGKRVLTLYLEPEAWKQMRMLSVNLETTTQGLGEQALNLLFEKHRLNRIA